MATTMEWEVMLNRRLRAGQSYRVGQVLLTGAAALGGMVLTFCWAVDVRPDPEVQQLLKAPSAVEAFKKGRMRAASQAEPRESLLVTQARAFARQANPPPPVQAGATGPKAAQPAAPPVALTPKFRLCGTSYCPWRATQSMALILEPTGELRWVKQGTDVGHVVIEQIKSGSIVYRSGSKTGEMEVEHF
jgi:hypothetical protein